MLNAKGDAIAPPSGSTNQEGAGQIDLGIVHLSDLHIVAPPNQFIAAPLACVQSTSESSVSTPALS